MFNDKAKNYGRVGNPENRFIKARNEFDNQVGKARVQAYHWRLACFLLILALFLTIGGLIYQSSKSRIEPYVIAVSEDGLAKAIGKAQPSSGVYTPKLPEIKYFLSKWVSYMRTIPTDAVVAKRDLLLAYDFLRPKAQEQANKMITSENILEQIGKYTRQVKIKAVIPQSEQSYQVRWDEYKYDESGKVVQDINMMANISLEFTELKDEKLLQNNPLGMYITDFYMTKEINN